MNILIADDHPLFRAGVIQAVEKCHDCHIIAEAENGEEALQKISGLNPDIAILDVRMPGKSGLEVLAALNECNSTVKVILLTMFKNPNYFYQAISLGAKGYLSKEDAVAEIINAIENVSTGKIYVSSSLSNLMQARQRSKSEIEISINAITSLTNMEREVLKLIADWKSNNEIAEQLFISSRTAGNHRTNISNKLNLHGTHSLIKFAIENKELFS